MSRTKSIAQKSDLLIATVASVLLVLLLSLNPTPALADSVTGPGGLKNYPLHLNLKDGQMWKIELTNIDYTGLTDYQGSGKKAFQFYVQEWDGGVQDWALIGIQVHKENYASAFQLFSDTSPHGPWTVQRTHGINASDWPFQTPFDLRLIMQHDGSAFIVWAYFRVPGNPNYSDWTLFHECRFDVLGPAVVPVIDALLNNANVQVLIDGQSDGTVTFDPPTVSIIYWKDYNGEEAGGYMPDIDQNQDFDLVQARTQENDTNITYSGQWTTYNVPGPSGGSIICSNDTVTPGSASFTFNGTSIRWIEARYTNRGKSEVWIDGQLMATVDAYGPLQWQQVLYSNNSLTPGPHTITLKVSGLKNPASSDYYLCVDAFDVDDIEKEYCAPVAEANSLWWLDKAHGLGIFEFPEVGEGYIGGDINGDSNADILDLVQELAIRMNTNVDHTGTLVGDEVAGIDTFLEDYGLLTKLYVHREDQPEFLYIEEEVERCQDVKLDLGFWKILACDGLPGNGSIVWQRVGGHAVTVAGVDSPNFLLAISDPDNDAAESGAPGVVRPLPGGHLAHAGDPTIHNNEMFASHDIYTVVPSASPGGIWALKNYPGKVNFPTQEWGQPTPTPWPPDFYPCEESMIITEIEAAVIVSPIICGNGHIDPGEECDDGNTNNGDGCSSTCIIEFCGDGTVQQGLGEQCDDGNNTSGDGCSSTCIIEFCGDGVVQQGLGEQCDDGNNISGDGCSSTCIIESCGDGITQQGLGEECDDGNNVSEDGCSATCQWEVIVVDPNGGEVIPSGSNYLIKWSTPVGSTAVKFDVEYSMNNGTIWNAIASKVAGSSYSWAVPKPPKNKPNCLVRVTGYDASNIKVDDDISNAKFKIEVVKVTSPNGGENWKVGSTHAITWTTNGTKTPVKKAKLFYTYNGGANWILIYTFLNSNPGTYNWTVPAASSANCKVKVVLKNKLGNTIGTDMSDSTFTISSP